MVEAAIVEGSALKILNLQNKTKPLFTLFIKILN